MMRERKRQRALLRLRLRDVAARDATRNSFGVFVCFFVRLQRGGGEAYEDFSLISASSRRALWIPRGTTRGGLRCVMMYALLMFY